MVSPETYIVSLVPFQKILNYMEKQSVCRALFGQLYSQFGIPGFAPNLVNPSRLKVFEKGFGEKLFSKSFSPISPITY